MLFRSFGINIINLEVAAIVNTIGLNIVLISIIWAFYHFGYKTQNTSAVAGANSFILAYISVLYFKISYNFLDKALFFFLGGVILLSLGIYLEKQKKGLKKQKTGGNTDEQ